MKTVYDSKTANQFTPMFRQATDFLKAHKSALSPERQVVIDSLGEVGITSVQEYFSYLADLWALKGYGGERFIMLPFNEPEFVIDPDKREILVPSDFKKNGVSVQFDEIAESLIFRIDRFFDYADLGDPEMHIQVLWERSDGYQNLTNIDIVDRNNADYIRFLWPLRHEITDIPGVIKFAVRFYRTIAPNTSEVVYVFNTKVANATITAGHKFKVDEWPANRQGTETASVNFDYAIINSRTQGVDNVHIPEFLINLAMHRANMEEGAQENYDLPEQVTPETQEIQAFIDVNNPKQRLIVTALAEDAGYISYQWAFKDQVTNTTYSLLAHDEFIPSSDRQAVDWKTYYIENPDWVEGEVANNTPRYIADTWVEEAGKVYYERYSVVDFGPEVTEGQISSQMFSASGQPIEHYVGLVTVNAKNTVGTTTSDPALNTKALKFPGPIKPVLTSDLNAEEKLDSNGSGILSVDIEEEPFTTYTYTWMTAPSRLGAYEPIESGTEGISMNGRSMEIDNKPGFYKVQVQALRNFYTADQFITESTAARVTKPIRQPVITSPLVDTPASTQYGNATLTVVVEPFNDILVSDRIEYQWFKYGLNERNEVVAMPLTDAQASGVWNGVDPIQYVVERHVEGGYFCKIYNYLGTDEPAVTISPDFSVTMYTPEGGTAPGESNVEG